jgi:hypothetical protein
VFANRQIERREAAAFYRITIIIPSFLFIPPKFAAEWPQAMPVAMRVPIASELCSGAPAVLLC